ncbi:MAG: nucleotidyltransferase family protein [Tangfeifania sp.]
MVLDSGKIEYLNEYFSNKPVLKAYIFGSVAKGQEKINSDVDILVDLDYSERIGLRFVQMKLDLEKILDRNVDLVSSRGLSPYLKPFIEKDKQLIYARKNGG